MPFPSPIQTILTPQGAEYRAVFQGLRRVAGFKPQVIAIPMGPRPVAQFLEQMSQRGETPEQGGVLLMGLGGSLSTDLTVGDVVLCKTCIDQASIDGGKTSEGKLIQQYECDRALIDWLSQRLTEKVMIGTGVTCDRVISSAEEKRQLGHIHSADVVDMESATVLDNLDQQAASVAILRVISDDCRHPLPDISAAIRPDGSLQTIPLAISFLKQPLAAIRLIRGSLQSLKVLQAVTTELFSRNVSADRHHPIHPSTHPPIHPSTHPLKYSGLYP